MGRTIPKAIDDRLNFFTVHLPLWEADPAAIGLTSAEVAAVRDLLDQAAEATRAASAARSVAEGATMRQNQALAGLTESGANLIARVRAFAQRDINVLGAAGLAPPGAPTRSEIPPPTPLDFAAAPRSDGSIELTWTSDLKRTSFYRITRGLTMDAGPVPFIPFQRAETIGVVRDGRFIDTRLPVGFAQVAYWIIPCRQRRGGPIIEGAARQAVYRAGTIEAGVEMRMPRAAAA